MGALAADAKAATKVAGRPTTTPAAAARPILLRVGIPVMVITMLVRIPAPDPGQAGAQSDCSACDVVKRARGWLVHHRADSFRKRKSRSEGQTKQSENPGHQAAAKVRCCKLCDDDPSGDTRPQSRKKRISVFRARPVC
jgi:hypothetical protein